MQNSLTRILEGIAESLGETVLPAVSDPYARSQVKAAIEILGNLATRVEWDRDQLEELVTSIDAALSGAGHQPPSRSGDLESDRAAHLRALGEAVADADDEVLRGAMLEDLRRELERLRTGMYR